MLIVTLIVMFCLINYVKSLKTGVYYTVENLPGILFRNDLLKLNFIVGIVELPVVFDPLQLSKDKGPDVLKLWREAGIKVES